MDELEISGKRYISTRRAAKEYKYHADYMGQLIRGKKLLGRKVGRSWYVELDSLREYFGKEGGAIPQAETVAKAVEPEPVQMAEEVVEPVATVLETATEEVVEESMPIATSPAVTAIQEVEEPVAEKNIEIEEVSRESIHIPVRVRRPSFETPVVKKIPALTYVHDEEEFTSEQEDSTIPASYVMPRSEEEVVESREQEVYEKESTPLTKRRAFKPVASIVALGLVAFALVVGSSVLLKSHVVIEAGKAASVGLSLQ